MTDKKFLIDFPDEEEIEKQVGIIVNRRTFKKKSFLSFLAEMHQQLGLKNIFHDYLQLLAIGALYVVYLGFFIIRINLFSRGYLLQPEVYQVYVYQLYTYLFITSPLLYGLFLVSSLLLKQTTYEVEMVCKYTVYQVAAYRVLVLGMISIGLNIIQIIVTSLVLGMFDPIRAIMISLSSLLIFSVAFLYATRNSRSKLKQSIIALTWGVINIGIYLLDSDIYQKFLLEIPYGVYAGVIVTATILYIVNVRHFALNLKMRGMAR